MVAASNLWDQFTSGKALERVKKMKEQEELEEKMRREEQKRRAEEKIRNQKRLRQQMRERGMKEDELYKLFKAEMEEEDAEKESQLRSIVQCYYRQSSSLGSTGDTDFEAVLQQFDGAVSPDASGLASAVRSLFSTSGASVAERLESRGVGYFALYNDARCGLPEHFEHGWKAWLDAQNL